MKKFTDFNLKESTQRFIDLNGFTETTEIQGAVIPMALKGKDIVAISKTGTGKTHSFLVPVFEKINSALEEVQVVITAPTRELALQIYNHAKLYKEIDEKIDIKLITGGIERDRMAESIKTQPQIVIGTPGRIKDLFLVTNVLRCDKAKMFIVDEADMTFEYGFLDDIDAICSRMEDPQMMAFSATIPEGLKPFLKKYMENPQTIQVKQDIAFNPRIEHVLVPCRHLSYAEKLKTFLEGFMPYACIIFANTRDEAGEIAQSLRDCGKKVIEIHGGLQARQRKQAMKQIEALDTPYIVATDIAARGIDIEGVTHVISCGLPGELEFYTHRSGRTGRAGKDGVCYLLYHESDDAAIHALMKEGYEFEHKDFRAGYWKNLKPYGVKRISRNDKIEKEIAKTLTHKNEKVKPGYKKKKQAAIDEIKRKQRRDYIRSKIKEERVEIYKKRQIEKNKMKGK